MMNQFFCRDSPALQVRVRKNISLNRQLVSMARTCLQNVAPYGPYPSSNRQGFNVGRIWRGILRAAIPVLQTAA